MNLAGVSAKKREAKATATLVQEEEEEGRQWEAAVWKEQPQGNGASNATDTTLPRFQICVLYFLRRFNVQ